MQYTEKKNHVFNKIHENKANLTKETRNKAHNIKTEIESSTITKLRKFLTETSNKGHKLVNRNKN